MGVGLTPQIVEDCPYQMVGAFEFGYSDKWLHIVKTADGTMLLAVDVEELSEVVGIHCDSVAAFFRERNSSLTLTTKRDAVSMWWHREIPAKLCIRLNTRDKGLYMLEREMAIRALQSAIETNVSKQQVLVASNWGSYIFTYRPDGCLVALANYNEDGKSGSIALKERCIHPEFGLKSDGSGLTLYPQGGSVCLFESPHMTPVCDWLAKISGDRSDATNQEDIDDIICSDGNIRF